MSMSKIVLWPELLFRIDVTSFGLIAIEPGRCRSRKRSRVPGRGRAICGPHFCRASREVQP